MSGAELMRHALGVQAAPRSRRGYVDMLAPRWRKPYRNHFCAAGEHVAAWEGLVAAGLATKREGGLITGGFPTFYVTDAGREYALAGIVFKRRWGYGSPVHP